LGPYYARYGLIVGLFGQRRLLGFQQRCGQLVDRLYGEKVDRNHTLDDGCISSQLIPIESSSGSHEPAPLSRIHHAFLVESAARTIQQQALRAAEISDIEERLV
jgi:hypothetical protein